MLISDSSLLIFRSLSAHPLRTFLSSLGIAIGIASVVLLTSIGTGLQHYVVSEFTQFGSNILAINPGKSTTLGAGPAMFGTNRPLTLEDAAALQQVRHVESVVPVLQGNALLESHNRQKRTEIIGVSHAGLAMWKLEIAMGRFLPDDDLLRAQPVVVLGHNIYRDLFPDGNALNALMRIGGYRYRIIGILKPKGSILGFNMDDLVYIPTASAQEIFNRDSLMEIDISFNPNVEAKRIITAASELLERRHGRIDFGITTQDQMLKVLDDILSVLTMAIAALGAISLLVGAVGIVTLMTIAVSERTAEIGLFKALGAKSSQILGLFLSESLLLALLGGISGLLFAALIIVIVQLAAPGLPVKISIFYSSFAVISSAVLGLVAGVAPANRAARLNPIDALHSE